MLRWIFALLLIPFLDAVLLAVVVSQTSFLNWVGMVLLVVLTGLVGMLLVRAEGRRTLRKMQRSMVRGEPPTNELLDGGLLIAAGAFLLTPGLVTDAIGFLIAIPLTRIPIRLFVKRVVVTPYLDRKTGGFATGQVWTAGFPDGSSQQNTGSADSSTVDLGADSYRIDPEDVTQNEDGSYTIDDAGDTETRPDDDDDRDAVGR